MTDPTKFEFNSDVAAALWAAGDRAQIIAHEAGPSVLVTACRDDVTVRHDDLERYFPEPARARGTVKVFTAEGFCTAYQHRTVDDARYGAVVYADPDTCRLIAVLDDDYGAHPGWREHRVQLDLKPTDEWKLWESHQGYRTQEDFAEVIEAGENEIVEPSATTMLDIAQTFHATMGAKIKRANRLSDGRTQFVYDEDIEATAGVGGETTIPATFTIRVRPFLGAEPVQVECRLRYRVERGGAFKIGYQMDRPDEVKRESFARDVLDQIRVTLPDATLIEGVPADATEPGR